MIGTFRIGDFEARVVSKALGLCIDDESFTAEEFSHALVLKVRLDKMIKDKKF